MNEHEMTVWSDVRHNIYVSCSCGWASESLYQPSVGLLATVEGRHDAPNDASTSSDLPSSTGTKGDSCSPGEQL